MRTTPALGKIRETNPPLDKALQLLDLHYDAFFAVAEHAAITGHPVPMDTRGWSQILVSTLTSIKGQDRKKGADLVDGSDVKGANTWKAIDTPRFNGVIKAGTKAITSDKIDSLDEMPHLYFVLWDETVRKTARCRIWVTQCRTDPLFRNVCSQWYAKRQDGKIKSNNFQLHPPRGKDGNAITNNCGTLHYPLLFSAERAPDQKYEVTAFNPNARINGLCSVSAP